MGKKKSLVGWADRGWYLCWETYQNVFTETFVRPHINSVFKNKHDCSIKPIKVRITIEQLDQPKKARGK